MIGRADPKWWDYDESEEKKEIDFYFYFSVKNLKSLFFVKSLKILKYMKVNLTV